VFQVNDDAGREGREERRRRKEGLKEGPYTQTILSSPASNKHAHVHTRRAAAVPVPEEEGGNEKRN
jgi:hypothetical protein